MRSVADLVSPDRLNTLATPSNLRLGREIKDKGGVKLGEFGPLRVTATVGGTEATGSRRKVELRSENGELGWTCTCTNSDLFCKHCAAVALVTAAGADA